MHNVEPIKDYITLSLDNATSYTNESVKWTNLLTDIYFPNYDASKHKYLRVKLVGHEITLFITETVNTSSHSTLQINHMLNSSNQTATNDNNPLAYLKFFTYSDGTNTFIKSTDIISDIVIISSIFDTFHLFWDYDAVDTVTNLNITLQIEYMYDKY